MDTSNIILETNRTWLKKYTDEAKLQLLELVTDKEVMELVLNGPIEKEDFDAFIQSHFAGLNQIGLGVLYHKEDNAVIGFAGLHFLSRSPDKIEIGVVLGKSFQGKGYGKEVCDGEIELCRQLNHQQVFATVHPLNEASKKMLSKLEMSVSNEQMEFEDRGDRIIYNKYI